MEAEVDLLAAPVDSPSDFLATRGSLLTGCIAQLFVSALNIKEISFQVSLDELYPLRDQVSACCDLTATAVALDLLRFFYQVKSLNCQALSCLITSSRTFGCPGMTTQIRQTGLVHIFPQGDRKIMRSSYRILYRTQLAFDFVNGTGDQETASRLDELAVQVPLL